MLRLVAPEVSLKSYQLQELRWATNTCWRKHRPFLLIGGESADKDASWHYY